MPNVPNNLLRSFDCEEHAAQFISGDIRFGLLTYYRNVEGARQDSVEGKVLFSWGQESSQSEPKTTISYRGSSLNPYYIVSTSGPDVDEKVSAERFGRFKVRIDDPLALLERIKCVWRTHALALNDGIVIAPVDYNKGGVVAANEYLIAPPHYSYSQKPPCFDVEKEFRYVLTCSINVNRQLNDHLSLNIGDCSDICRFLR
ncbi:MAG: hypothetical protein ACXVBF_10455 [Flavisolibacter sp.]